MSTETGCLLHLTKYNLTVFYSKNLPGSRELTGPELFEHIISTVAGMKKRWQEGKLKRTLTLGHRWDKAVTVQCASSLQKVRGISAVSKDFLPSKYKQRISSGRSRKMPCIYGKPLGTMKTPGLHTVVATHEAVMDIETK